MEPVLRAVVTDTLKGERLDRALSALSPELSRTLARRWIDAGSVFVDDQRVRVASRRVWPGQILTAYRPHVSTDTAQSLHIVLQTADFLIVEKPAGMAVSPTRQGSQGTMVDLLAKMGRPALLTHRLDAPTSGLVVVAANREAQAELSSMLAEHAIDRRYVAVVSRPDIPPSADILAGTTDSFAIDVPLDGRSAKTIVTSWKPQGQRACLSIQLETGRTHQIRRHLQHVGAPILGDLPHGGLAWPRLMLHASELYFTWRGESISSKSSLPTEFSAESIS